MRRRTAPSSIGSRATGRLRPGEVSRTMRVLMTGSAGRIGRSLGPALRQAGFEVRTLDVEGSDPCGSADHIGADIRDLPLVRRITEDIDAVVHLGAIANDWPGHDDEVQSVNVQGTWNVLQACAERGIGRVVAFSSVQALGNFEGRRPSLYLPVDDTYPRHPMSAYQLSKHLGEEMCRSFSTRFPMTTICLRPTAVRLPQDYTGWRAAHPHFDDAARTIYWAHVDVRDVCDATLQSLTVDGVTHDAFLLAAEDTLATAPTEELLDRFYPDTPWRSGDRSAYFAAHPYRGLVDCSHAADVLGWRARHSGRNAPGW